MNQHQNKKIIDMLNILLKILLIFVKINLNIERKKKR